MKITILKEKLRDSISTIERIPHKSLSLPSLQNILLEGKKNFLCLSATNLELGIKNWTLTKIEREGKVSIPISLFSRLVNFLPDKVIELESQNFNLNIKCGNYQGQIKGINPDEFPIIPDINKQEMINLESTSFSEALNQVVNITSPSLSRPEISGVFFIFQRDSVEMVATDSFRLAEKKFFLKSSIPREYSLILPHQAAQEIINIFREKEGNINIYFSPNQILFESILPETPHPQTHFNSRLIEGEYPNYKAIIPKKSETQVQFQRKEFLNQIKSASLFSGKINEVKLKIDPRTGKVEIFSQNPDLGQYQSSLVGKINGKEIEVSFNHRFLIDGLLEIKTPEVVFELTDEQGPAVLKPIGTEDYLYVIMPIKAS